MAWIGRWPGSAAHLHAAQDHRGSGGADRHSHSKRWSRHLHWRSRCRGALRCTTGSWRGHRKGCGATGCMITGERADWRGGGGGSPGLMPLRPARAQAKRLFRKLTRVRSVILSDYL